MHTYKKSTLRKEGAKVHILFDKLISFLKYFLTARLRRFFKGIKAKKNIRTNAAISFVAGHFLYMEQRRLTHERLPVPVSKKTAQAIPLTGKAGILSPKSAKLLLWPSCKIRLMRTLITNIHKLYGIEPDHQFIICRKGAEMRELPFIENAWLLIDEEVIVAFGSADEKPPEMSNIKTIDASGRLVLPAFVDSHTHIVFATSREEEFAQRISGLSYAEIAARGGGILNSAKRLKEASEDALFESAMGRIKEVIAQGTGAIEIKSGYGLDLEGELKMLRVIRRIREVNLLPVRATFLAAHAYPQEYLNRKDAYIRYVIEEILPRVTGEGLADYIDVFCEEGFFGIPETEAILEAGAKRGLKAKIHANQLHRSGGVQVGVRHQALSVDHLECMGPEEIEALRHSDTFPVLLPAAAFFLGMQYQPARALIDAGLPVVLASDYNPGSCPSGNMPFLATLACTQMKMTPEEAINAMTLNGAAALEWNGELGTIARGKKANLIVTKPMDNIAMIPYDFGNNPVEKTFICGRSV